MRINETLRKDFPALMRRHRDRPVIYFDNACMTLKPREVIDAVTEYYAHFPGCHGRSGHLFGAETTRKFDESRDVMARFFNAASPQEIVFLRNATEGLNLLAHCLDMKEGDQILSSDIEHNSNLLPWQWLEKKKGIQRIKLPTNPDTTFNMAAFKACLTGRVKLVSVLHVSNLSGVTFPIEEIIKVAHGQGALVCIDAAQSALYKPLDVRKLEVDFLVTSVHKMWGPTGVGVLYGKEKLLESLPPFMTGGETVEDVTWEGHVLEASIPKRFEAGLQDYAGVIGSAAAIKYIKKIGQDHINRVVADLNAYASQRLSKSNDIRLIGPAAAAMRSGILNFFIKGMDAADVSRLLNESENIMTRYGRHCVHAWFNEKKYPDSLRVSFSAYNTFEEIDVFVDALEGIIKYFK